jgi:hypothetical protein
MLRFSVPLILFTISTLFAQEEPEKLKIVASKVLERTKEGINLLKQMEIDQTALLARLEMGVIDNSVPKMTIVPNSPFPVRFQNKKQMDEAIATAEAKLNQLKAKLNRHVKCEEYIYGPLLDKRHPKLEDFGQFLAPVIVHKVINKDTMLVRSSYKVEFKRIIQCPSGSTFVSPDFESKEDILMIRNTPTKGAVVNSPFKLEQVFQLTGMETYRTGEGDTNTVFVATPMNTKKVEELLKK